MDPWGSELVKNGYPSISMTRRPVNWFPIVVFCICTIPGMFRQMFAPSLWLGRAFPVLYMPPGPVHTCRNAPSDDLVPPTQEGCVTCRYLQC